MVIILIMTMEKNRQILIQMIQIIQMKKIKIMKTIIKVIKRKSLLQALYLLKELI